MKKVLPIIAGVVVIMVALWAGAFGWQVIPPKDAAFGMAMLFTQVGLIGGGMALIGYGACNL